MLMSQTIMTEAQLAAIGAVAVESTYCENLIEGTIWQLLGIAEDRGKHVTQDMQITRRLDLFEQLARDQLTDAAALAELKARVITFKAAVADRNTVVHGRWQSPAQNYLSLIIDGPEKYPPAFARKRVKKTDVPRELAADRVLEVAEALSDHRRWLQDFAARAWPDAWVRVSFITSTSTNEKKPPTAGEAVGG